MCSIVCEACHDYATNHPQADPIRDRRTCFPTLPRIALVVPVSAAPAAERHLPRGGIHVVHEAVLRPHHQQHTAPPPTTTKPALLSGTTRGTISWVVGDQDREGAEEQPSKRRLQRPSQGLRALLREASTEWDFPRGVQDALARRSPGQHSKDKGEAKAYQVRQVLAAINKKEAM